RPHPSRTKLKLLIRLTPLLLKKKSVSEESCTAMPASCSLPIIVLLSVAALQLTLNPTPADGFSGIVSGGGKASCQVEGGVCFTQGACCEDFSCEGVTISSPYGRCTSRRANMRLAGEGACQTDADCPAASCCVAVRSRRGAPTKRQPRRGRRCGECGVGVENSDSMESLFNQYYSAMMRKRFG
uniref:Ixodegrin protein n=2 Tax=Macrostomum lignano TaxID=282301 RepID=A0A1I8GQX1_9PLAT